MGSSMAETVSEQLAFIQKVCENNNCAYADINDTLIPIIYNMLKNNIIDIDKYESMLSKIDYGILINYYGVYFTLLKNYKIALDWFQKSADLGCSASMSTLGGCYYHGRGIGPDYKMAVHWYRKSADLGCHRSMNSLGCRYYSGQGIEQDYKMALDWFRKSAVLGNSDAMQNLGECYYYGHGVDKDIITAIEWYNLAAGKGNTDAINKLSNMYVINIIECIIDIKMLNEQLEDINEHLKLFPGTEYKKAKVNFLHTSSL